MDQTTLTIIFGIIGAIGILFGVYNHLKTLKFAKLFYEVKEISEFKLPIEFYKDISSIPFRKIL